MVARMMMTSVDLMRLRLIGSGMAIIAYSLDNIMPLYYGQAGIKKSPVGSFEKSALFGWSGCHDLYTLGFRPVTLRPWFSPGLPSVCLMVMGARCACRPGQCLPHFRAGRYFRWPGCHDLVQVLDPWLCAAGFHRVCHFVGVHFKYSIPAI